MKGELLIGQTIGHLTVLGISHVDKNYNTYLTCQCECGFTKPIFYGSLKTKKTKSCGRTSNCKYAFKIAQDSKLGIGLNDLTGKKFGYLTVLKLLRRGFNGSHVYECRCDCGHIKEVWATSLRSGSSKSCGRSATCKFAYKLISDCQVSHGLSNSDEFTIWQGIKQRCYNAHDPGYENWGGRGITMYEPWINNFLLFYEYICTLPETKSEFESRTGKNATIDRKDNNKNYEPDNLRWASIQEQSQNRRTNIFNDQIVKFILWEYKVNKLNCRQICKLLGFNRKYLKPIYNILVGVSWSNINIDDEIAEYERFGTVNVS